MDARPETALFRLPSSLAPRCPPPPHLFLWGSLLIASALFSYSAFLYSVLISKLLPPSGISFLSAIEKDWYYCLLIPLTGPIVVIAVYLHWLSMKLFKHA